MSLARGTKLGHYEIVEPIRLRQDYGGQVGARGINNTRELWRGLAVANPRILT